MGQPHPGYVNLQHTGYTNVKHRTSHVIKVIPFTSLSIKTSYVSLIGFRRFTDFYTIYDKNCEPNVYH
jgi:hypothetical protein